MQLGWLASGVGCYGLARLAFSEAATAARKEGLLALEAFVELDRALIESYLWNFGAAFDTAVKAIHGVPLLQRSAHNIFEARDDPEGDWQHLPEYEQLSVEKFHMFYAAMLPGFARALEAGRDSANSLSQIERMRLAMQPLQNRLLDYEGWCHLAGRMKFAFDGNVRRDSVISAIQALKQGQDYERLILYAAIARRQDTPPAEVANAQAILLAHLNALQQTALARQSVCRWIVGYWHDEAAVRGFRLNSPSLLRGELAGVSKTSGEVSDAARVLLAAEAAADAAFDRSTRDQLRAMRDD